VDWGGRTEYGCGSSHPRHPPDLTRKQFLRRHAPLRHALVVRVTAERLDRGAYCCDPSGRLLTPSDRNLGLGSRTIELPIVALHQDAGLFAEFLRSICEHRYRRIWPQIWETPMTAACGTSRTSSDSRFCSWRGHSVCSRRRPCVCAVTMPRSRRHEIVPSSRFIAQPCWSLSTVAAGTPAMLLESK
jgi:hypothetical protein